MTNSEERLKQLHEIRARVRRYEEFFNEFLAEIGWTKEKTIEGSPKEVTEAEQCDEKGSTLADVRCEKDIQPSTSAPATDFEEIVNFCSTIDQKRASTTNLPDWNKLRRDLKRRRVKYRTTKSAPLTYTEELRELINLQMDLIKDNK